MNQKYWSYTWCGMVMLLAIPETPWATDLKVTAATGETFLLTEAAVIDYEPEGSGGSGRDTAGLYVRTAQGRAMLSWKTIRQIQITGRGKNR